jgi:hypothetical protein
MSAIKQRSPAGSRRAGRKIHQIEKMHHGESSIVGVPPLPVKLTASNAMLDGLCYLGHHRNVQSNVQTKCPQCGAAMICLPEGGCWCSELPRVPMPAGAKACLCSNCLRAKIAALQKSAEKK